MNFGILYIKNAYSEFTACPIIVYLEIMFLLGLSCPAGISCLCWVQAAAGLYRVRLKFILKNYWK